MSNTNKEEIKKMSYTEFVGFINQWNVLPGAYTSIAKWKVFGNVDSFSNVLEVACTTGFSLREMAKLSNCKGIGIDICESSVKAANENKEKYASNYRINYEVADAYEFKSQIKFSHVIVGASLNFFKNPKEAITNIVNLLEDGGMLLASPFYIQKPIPASIVAEFETVFGIRPTTESYKDIMKLYEGFEIIYQDHNELIEETEDELKHYCESTIQRVCMEKNITSKEIVSCMYDRLYEIKLMSNKLRPYQKYCVLALRYNSQVYPNRYVELF